MFGKRARKHGKVCDIEAHAWIVKAPKEFGAFLRNLHVLVPDGSVLFIEGVVGDDVKAFLRSRQPDETPDIRRDTLWPREAAFHLPVTRDNLGLLADMTDNHALPEVLTHVKAYADMQALLVWTDVLSGDPLMVSKAVGEESMREFCRRVDSSYGVQA